MKWLVLNIVHGHKTSVLYKGVCVCECLYMCVCLTTSAQRLLSSLRQACLFCFLPLWEKEGQEPMDLKIQVFDGLRVA
jgi:hypothetical protein